MRFAVPDDKAQPTDPNAQPAKAQPAKAQPAKPTGLEDGHHLARDGRQAARARSERDHARHGGGSKARSYTFRRH